ncbi:MAG: hypothetical protein ABH834_03885 [Candidatus Altiarchaeota archaeon]
MAKILVMPSGNRGDEHVAAMEAFAGEIGFQAKELPGVRRAKGFWHPGALECLPAVLVENIETVISSKFDPARQAELGYEPIGSVPGKVRSLKFKLDEPKTVDDTIIYGVKLRAVTFDPDKLATEFDLGVEHRKLGLRRPITLYNMAIDEKGIVQYTPLVNEPGGGMFCRATLHESMIHRLCRSRDEDVDVLLNMGFFPDVTPNSGNVMAYDALGLVDEDGLTTGELVFESFKRHQRAMAQGRQDAIAAFQDDITLFSTRHVARLRGFHSNDFFHSEPHHGNFRQSGNGRVVVADLTDARDLAGMPYDQRIGYLTWDAIGPLMYARMRENQIRQVTGASIDFMTPALTYFQSIDAGDPILSELDKFIRFDERGWCTLRDLHNLSEKNQKPITFYKSNPLVKAVMAEHPQ